MNQISEFAPRTTLHEELVGSQNPVALVVILVKVTQACNTIISDDIANGIYMHALYNRLYLCYFSEILTFCSPLVNVVIIDS